MLLTVLPATTRGVVVGLPDHIQHRTALRRVTVEDAVQILWRECIGQGLCAVPIGDPDKGVVSHGKVDTGVGQLARQPAVAVAVELQPKRAPRRHSQIDQAELGIHKVEIIVEGTGAFGFVPLLTSHATTPIDAMPKVSIINARMTANACAEARPASGRNCLPRTL
jgi:hypothetical protein